jgi:hypothetical protein
MKINNGIHTLTPLVRRLALANTTQDGVGSKIAPRKVMRAIFIVEGGVSSVEYTVILFQFVTIF